MRMENVAQVDNIWSCIELMHHNLFYDLFIGSAFSIDIYSNAPTIRPGCALEKRLGASFAFGWLQKHTFFI